MLQNCRVLGVEDVDLLLVCDISSLFIICALCLLSFTLLHFVQHDNNVLLLVVKCGAFFRSMDTVDISDRSCSIWFRLDTLLENSLGLFFVSIQVFEFSLELTHD